MYRGEIESILLDFAGCESSRRVNDMAAFFSDEEKGEWRRSNRTWHDTIAAINNVEIREAAFCWRHSGTDVESVGSCLKIYINLLVLYTQKVSRTYKDRRNACGGENRTSENRSATSKACWLREGRDVCRGGEQDVLFFAMPFLRVSRGT